MARKIDYQALSKELVHSLILSGDIDEVSVDDLWYVFRPEIKVSSEKVYTGVEFLGDKESYFRTVYKVKPLNLEGVYDVMGNRVKCDFDPARLNLDYQDDYTRIIYN